MIVFSTIVRFAVALMANTDDVFTDIMFIAAKLDLTLHPIFIDRHEI